MPNQSDLLTHHISQQFNHELEELRNNLLSMGGMVEKQVSDAIESLINADSDLAIVVCDPGIGGCRMTQQAIEQLLGQADIDVVGNL